MTPASRRETVLLPILFTCLAFALYCVADSTVKHLARTYHFSQMVFIYAGFTLAFIGTYAAIRDGRHGFRTKSWRLVLLRCLLSQGSVIGNVLALPHVPLADFYAIVFASPFLVAIFSSLLLRETLPPQRLAVIIAGFAVVLAVFLPGGGIGSPGLWHLVVFASTSCYALQVVTIRHILRRHPGESRAFMFIAGALMTLLWSAPFLPGRFIPPTPFDWGLAALGAACAATGFLCMAFAVQKAASAAIIAPYHYTQMIWGCLLGWIFFHEVPAPRTIIGAVAIIELGLYLAWSENRKARVIAADTTAPT
jgi:drug/metabolite transporter (DMT)-like permease